MPQIEVEHVYKIFGPNPPSVVERVKAGVDKSELLEETGHTVGLADIDLTVDKGEIFVVMGLSGSGKSTLIRHFNRLIEPTSGRLLFDGVDVTTLSKMQLSELRQSYVSMVFQGFGLLPHRKVIDNVAFGLEIRGIAKTERRKRALEWVETVGLQGYEDVYPSKLSGGMKQRVGLARALCTEPQLLLMDEAFSALDPLIRSAMQDQLLLLHEKLGMTVVFITHDLGEALHIGQRIAILKDGLISQIGTPADILLHPADDYVREFVRSVNRAQVLSIKRIMRPAPLTFSDETIQGVLLRMRETGSDHAYAVLDGRYQGIVFRKDLEALSENQREGKAMDLARSDQGEPLRPSMTVECAVARALRYDHPLPVIDEQQGTLCGVIYRDDMARMFES